MMRRLIVNADDFGRSHSINQAVIQAHQRGILTTASLMVNGEAADEAVELARENPKLGIGLHLALAHGKSTLPHAEIPDLVDRDQNFSNNPVWAGLNYFFNGGVQEQLRKEITAQFHAFRATGLPLDHVNGHLHFHLHPTVFRILFRHYYGFKIDFNRVRRTREPFWLNTKIAQGRWGYRISHAIIFRYLSWRARLIFRSLKWRHTDWVFGLLQNGLVDEQYICKLLPNLPEGDSELYSHPSLDEFKHEFDALMSPTVRQMIDRLGIKLIRYADL